MTTPSLADKVPSVASWGTSEQRKVDVREPEEHLTTMIDISAHLLCRDAGRFGRPPAAKWLIGRGWPELWGSLRHALGLVKPAWRQSGRTLGVHVFDMGAHSTCSELLQSCSVNSTPALPRSLFAAALSAQLRCEEKISTTEAVLAETTRAAPAPALASGFTCLFPRAPMPMANDAVRRSERNARGVWGAPETARVNPWHVTQQARQASSEWAERMLCVGASISERCGALMLLVPFSRGGRRRGASYRQPVFLFSLGVLRASGDSSSSLARACRAL